MFIAGIVNLQRKEKAMRRLIVLSIIGLIFFNGCAVCGPVDWVRRNTIHKRYYMDPQKEVEAQARIYENWPTTRVTLENRSAIKSIVKLEYDFPTAIDPLNNRVIKSRFKLVYEIPPRGRKPGRKTVELPTNTKVVAVVENHCLRNYDRRDFNTGNIFPQVIDVTPKGAETVFSSGRTAMVNFFNPSRTAGTLTIQRIDSGNYDRSFSAQGTTEREELRMIGSKPIVRTVMPGLTETRQLEDGYYWIVLKTERQKKFRIQVANGRVYAEKGGRPVSPYFEFWKADHDPGVLGRELNVPHKIPSKQ